MDFHVFDTVKMEEYARKAKEKWGLTKEYQEYEKKAIGQSFEEQKAVGQNFMLLFEEFGKMKEKSPESSEVQMKVKDLQEYISQHFYQCSDEILSCLGTMYAAGGEFTENIDRVAGRGTAVFVAKAIEICCK